MPRFGVKFYRTPFKPYVTAGSKRERIKIAQPIDKPIYLTSHSSVNKQLLKKSPWYYALHKRGISRPLIGEDPLEARAVSHDAVRGTLPERIVYKWLVSQLRLVDGIDFEFQSSQSGGRMELGGIVVDFTFPQQKFAIQVQGYTHTEYRRMMKDDEQDSILAEFGYFVYKIEDTDIYNEARFEQIMRKIFNITSNTGNASGSIIRKEMDSERQPVVDEWERIYQQAMEVLMTLEAMEI